jgi:hypothetical protein
MASSSRALNAILPQIPKSPYEAHQKARTFASRYVKSGQYDTAIDVLFQSARDLFKNNQPGSGVDLAGFMLDVYDTKGESVTAESRGTLLFRLDVVGIGVDLWMVRKIDAADCVDGIRGRVEEDVDRQEHRVRPSLLSTIQD